MHTDSSTGTSAPYRPVSSGYLDSPIFHPDPVKMQAHRVREALRRLEEGR